MLFNFYECKGYWTDVFKYFVGLASTYIVYLGCISVYSGSRVPCFSTPELFFSIYMDDHADKPNYQVNKERLSFMFLSF